MLTGTGRRWLLPAFIVVSLLCLFFVGSRFGSPANIQAQLQAGTKDGILVVPIQIERDSYGLAMVDTVGQTLWVYEITAQKQLRLLAARSW